jgi:polar amino acid transport system substrate-binding protein
MKLLLAVLICILGYPASACSLRVSPEEWPPYIYRSGSKLTGADFELITAILKQAGCSLQLQTEVPPARRHLLFQQGRLDLLLAASDTPERRGFARFSLPYRNETVGLFALPHRASRFRSAGSFSDLVTRQAALLTPRVGFYGSDYERALPVLNVNGRRSTFTSFEQGVRMLEAGRGDLIMGDAAALRYVAQQLGVQIEALAFVPFRAPVHIMLNAASTTREQLERINKAITRLEQSGALGAIRARYGVD